MPTSLAEWLPINLVLILLNFFQKSTYMTHWESNRLSLLHCSLLPLPIRHNLKISLLLEWCQLISDCCFHPIIHCPPPTAPVSTLILLFILNDFLLKTLLQNLHVTEDPSYHQALSFPFPTPHFSRLFSALIIHW